MDKQMNKIEKNDLEEQLTKYNAIIDVLYKHVKDHMVPKDLLINI